MLPAKLLQSRTFWCVAALALLLSLHEVIKRNAVAAAVQETVSKFEIETLEASRKFTAKALMQEAEAKAQLKRELANVSRDLMVAEAELEKRYESFVAENPLCRIDDDLFERLQLGVEF